MFRLDLFADNIFRFAGSIFWPITMSSGTMSSSRSQYLLTLFSIFYGVSIFSGIWLLSASPALADWPLVRGDSKASGVASCRLPARPGLIWKISLPNTSIEATAVIVSGVVYVADVEGGLHAIGLDDGARLWTKHFDDCGFLKEPRYPSRNCSQPAPRM